MERWAVTMNKKKEQVKKPASTTVEDSQQQMATQLLNEPTATLTNTFEQKKDTKSVSPIPAAKLKATQEVLLIMFIVTCHLFCSIKIEIIKIKTIKEEN
jgi:hypothetical protein